MGTTAEAAPPELVLTRRPIDDVKPTFAQVFESEESPLLRYAHGLVGQAETAEDLVQDAFVKLHSHWDEVENPKAWLFAIVGAEHILRLLPKGTHEYKKFIKPSELAACIRRAGLDVVESVGMTYNPLTRQYRLGNDVDVNYLIHARKPEA